MKDFSKNAAIRSAVYFTITVTIFCLVVLFANSNDDAVSLDPSRIILMLPFCICFAIANTTLKSKSIGTVTRWLIHAALTIIGAYLFVILPAKFDHSSAKFMGLIVVCAVYAVGLLIYSLFSIRVKNAITEDKKLKERAKR